MADFTKNMDSAVSTLITERETWEKGTYAASNAELYNILAQCYELYTLVKTSKSHYTEFKELYKLRKYVETLRTSTEVKIIRMIFGGSGAREFTYARVLKVAHDEMQAGQTLQNFIISRGGIEEIRRAKNFKKYTGMTEEQYRKLAEEHVSGFAVESSYQLPNYFKDSALEGNKYAVAIAHVDEHSKAHIVHTSCNATLVKRALAVAGREIDTRETDDDAESLAEIDAKNKANKFAMLSKKQTQKNVEAAMAIAA